jgi:hypothetical protein
MRMWCATRDNLMVKPQNYPPAGFDEFGPQNSAVLFQRESEAARDVIAKNASR